MGWSRNAFNRSCWHIAGKFVVALDWSNFCSEKPLTGAMFKHAKLFIYKEDMIVIETGELFGLKRECLTIMRVRVKWS